MCEVSESDGSAVHNAHSADKCCGRECCGGAINKCADKSESCHSRHGCQVVFSYGVAGVEVDDRCPTIGFYCPETGTH